VRFGLWSNGFRPHTSAAQTYEEDLREIVIADELGFEEVWLSEHHAEPLYVGKVDVLPVPELLMCKAAAVTGNIRFGSAVKVIHLSHPVDIAARAAVTDHVIGGGRYMFGFGTGFPTALFSLERGLSYDDRHARTLESLELILQCWSTEEPFDWDGRFWQGRGITVLPKPLQRPHMPIATATMTAETVELAGRRGYALLTAGGSPERIAKQANTYAHAAGEAGLANAREAIRVSSFVYIADTQAEAIAHMRPAVEYEMGFQRERGALRFIASGTGLDPDTLTFEDLVAAGVYVVGDSDTVYARLERLHEASGGFGVLLLGAGKAWASSERREESLRRFAAEVAPRLARLQPPG
jgi:alkanesulfonate monooxygenase SsuD/methylene tetrahydromethanopterin reductase-like flavin-dependent oxidoreductase (luciferase family)